MANPVLRCEVLVSGSEIWGRLAPFFFFESWDSWRSQQVGGPLFYHGKCWCDSARTLRESAAEVVGGLGDWNNEQRAAWPLSFRWEAVDPWVTDHLWKRWGKFPSPSRRRFRRAIWSLGFSTVGGWGESWMCVTSIRIYGFFCHVVIVGTWNIHDIPCLWRLNIEIPTIYERNKRGYNQLLRWWKIVAGIDLAPGIVRNQSRMGELGNVPFGPQESCPRQLLPCRHEMLATILLEMLFPWAILTRVCFV